MSVNLDQEYNQYKGQSVLVPGQPEILRGQCLSIPIFKLSLFSYLYSIFNAFMSPQPNRFIIYSYLGNPAFSFRIPRYTSISAFIFSTKSRVSNIRTITAYSKISFSIIESITINMVDVQSFWSINQKTVHRKKPFRSSFLSIKLPPGFIKLHVPFSATITKIIKAVDIFVVDKVNFSAISLTIYNQFSHIYTSYQMYARKSI